VPGGSWFERKKKRNPSSRSIKKKGGNEIQGVTTQKGEKKTLGIQSFAWGTFQISNKRGEKKVFRETQNKKKLENNVERRISGTGKRHLFL